MNHQHPPRAFARLLLCLPGLLALLFLLTPLARAQNEVDTPENWRFGVIESDENPSAATRLGVSWTRVRFQWAEVQPDSPDDWQPPLDDEALERELDDGRMVVGLLIGIPDWARDDNLLPSGLDRAVDDPDNTWAVFVRDTVERYAGQIDHWVIWNEPDIADPDALGHTWDGSIEEFVQLLRVAYLAAKEANPDAVIHLGAFTHFWDPEYFGRFLDELVAAPEAAENAHYFDVATAHLYFQPDVIYDVLQLFREDMARRGLEKPIWLVETNAPPADDSYWPVPNWTLYVTQYEQAAFIPQALASALAAGAERVSIYKLMDTDSDREANPEPFGLLRQDGSRRPAFDTYSVAIQQFADVLTARRERWDAVGQIRLEQPDQTTTVLFARLPQTQQASVFATATEAQLIDMWGESATIEAVDGVFQVELPGSLCIQTIGDYCMIGGTVYYLVQDRGPRALDDLPIEDADNLSAPPTWLATATAGPPPTRMPLPTPPEVRPTATPAATTTATPVTQLPAATAVSQMPETAASSDEKSLLPEETMAQNATLEETKEQDLSRPTQQFSGLVLIGLGLVIAVGIGGWWVARNRDA